LRLIRLLKRKILMSKPLEDAPTHIKLAVDLIMILEQHDVEPEEVLKALDMVVFRNLCHFSIIKKTGVTHDSIFRLQQSIS